MQRKKPDVDVIRDLLQEAARAFPHSTFIQSIGVQYQERGGLSKKQLQGLYEKARKVKTIPIKWLATLEAEILRKPTRYKSVTPPKKSLYQKDEHVGEMISSVLAKYPAHKRVLFLKSKYEHDEPLSAVELAELERFAKLQQ